MSHELKILLTGGHAHATAYALVKEIKKFDHKVELFWIGPKSLIEGKELKGVEDGVFRQLGVKVFNINAGRLQTRYTKYTVRSILRIPLGFFQSLLLVTKIRPNITVSFGGFVGLPIVIASKLQGIPVIIHEQTVTAGRGNLYASKFANKVAISRGSSKKYFPAAKTVLVGNPIDESILSVRRKSKIGKKPILFITGGHTGSTSLNEVILAILPKLLSTYKVIHQSGLIDYNKCLNAIKMVKKVMPADYELYPNIDPRNWPQTLEKADIVISRAGANTVFQLVALKIPSLLIPIPHTYLNEQVKNADYAVDFGIARKLTQDELTPDNILREVEYLRGNWQEIVSSVKDKKSPDLHASKNFAKLILNEAKKY